MIVIDPLWRRPLRDALLVVYGPFVVMTIAMVLFVPCAHCREAATEILPAAPGYAAARIVLGRVSAGDAHAASWWTGAGFGAAAVFVVAAAAKRGGRLRLTAFGLAAALFSIVAFGTAALIRM
jgi:hypothetical protein